MNVNVQRVAVIPGKGLAAAAAVKVYVVNVLPPVSTSNSGALWWSGLTRETRNLIPSGAQVRILSASLASDIFSFLNVLHLYPCYGVPGFLFFFLFFYFFFLILPSLFSRGLYRVDHEF